MTVLRWWRSLFGTAEAPVWTQARPHEPGDLAVGLLLAALRCVAWGVGAGAACGAVAGTVVFPGVGTLYGPVFGAYAGAVASVPLTPVVLVVLVRHRHGVGALVALRTSAAAVVAALLVGCLGYVVAENPDPAALADVEPWALAWLGTAVLATTATLVGTFRWAAPSIARGWHRALGQREVPAPLPGLPLEPVR